MKAPDKIDSKELFGIIMLRLGRTPRNSEKYRDLYEVAGIVSTIYQQRAYEEHENYYRRNCLPDGAQLSEAGKRQLVERDQRCHCEHHASYYAVIYRGYDPGQTVPIDSSLNAHLPGCICLPCADRRTRER